MTSFPLRPFDGHAVTFTLREIHAPSSAEFKSLYHDAEEPRAPSLTPVRRRPASICAIPKARSLPPMRGIVRPRRRSFLFPKR